MASFRITSYTSSHFSSSFCGYSLSIFCEPEKRQLVYFSSRFSSFFGCCCCSIIVLCEYVSFINGIDCRFVDFIKYISSDDWVSMHAIRFVIIYCCLNKLSICFISFIFISRDHHFFSFHCTPLWLILVSFLNNSHRIRGTCVYQWSVFGECIFVCVCVCVNSV